MSVKRSKSTTIKFVLSTLWKSIIFSCAVSTFAGASILIDDPKDYLSRLTTIPKSFSKQYICSSQQKFFIRKGRCQIECPVASICKTTCENEQYEEAIFQIEDCTTDQVHLYTTTGQDWILDQSTYQKSRQTTAFHFAQIINDFFEPLKKIIIASINYPLRGTLLENGKIKTIMVAQIHLDAVVESEFTGQEPSEQFVLEVNMSADGLDQLLYLGRGSSSFSSQDYILKRKGYIHASP